MQRFRQFFIGGEWVKPSGLGSYDVGRHRGRVEDHIRLGRDDAAEIAFGGGRPRGLKRGYYVEPPYLPESATTAGSPAR